MRALLLAGLAIALVAAAPAAAQTQPVDTTPTVSADGLGTATLTPDLATFEAYVRSTQRTSAKAQKVANGHVRDILKAAGAAGVAREDLLTLRVTVFRTTVRVGKKRHRTAYRAEQVLRVTVRRIPALSGLLAAVADAGADIDGPEFGFADPTQGRLLATRAALADARARADDAAAQQGLRVTGVRSIVLDPSSDDSGGEGGSADSKAAVPAAGGAIEPGTQQFVEQVRVIYTAAPAT